MDIGKITPHVLLSQRDTPLTWKKVLGELCDNAFDANAKRVEITFGPRGRLTVFDDGNGCDNIERMLTIGSHYSQPTTRLGRFGVGLKDAACWLWGETLISTVSRGQRLTASVDWGLLAKQQTWFVPDPIVTPAAPGEGGTRIEFENSQKRSLPDYDKLRDELGYVFAPALWEGRQIVLNCPRRRQLIVAGWRMPPLTEVVEDTFEVNGKAISLRAGLVDDDAVNSRPGFSFFHGHRMILNSSFGAKDYSTGRICGQVQLLGDWVLSRNKTEIVDEDGDQLEEAIFSRCRVILEKAKQQSMYIRNSSLEADVSKSLRSILSEQQKAKRASRSNPSGAVEPKGSAKRHRKAKHVQPGDTFNAIRNVGAMRMEWRPREDGQIGEVDLPGAVIYLNSQHCRLSYHSDRANRDALVDVCMTLLSHVAIESEQRDRLPFARDREGFVDVLSHVLAHQEQSRETVEAQQS